MSPRVATKTTAPAAAPTWRNRITGSGEEAPDQLLANPANWRIHPKAQQDALAGALDQVGWVQQVLVNRRTGFVVDGHARVALALSRGGGMTRSSGRSSPRSRWTMPGFWPSSAISPATIRRLA